VKREVYTEYSQNSHSENYVTRIFYPSIIDSDSLDTEKKINQLIEEEIVNHCDVDDGINTYEVDYEIKYMGGDYISILFQGTRTPQGGPHPVDVAWGVTVDLSIGGLANISCFIEDNKLQKKIMDGKYDTKRGWIQIHMRR